MPRHVDGAERTSGDQYFGRVKRSCLRILLAKGSILVNGVGGEKERRGLFVGYLWSMVQDRQSAGSDRMRSAFLRVLDLKLDL